MMLREVPDYIGLIRGRQITRQTVYNWVKRGKNGVKLQTFKMGLRHERGGRKTEVVTSDVFVDRFCRAVSIHRAS